MIVYFLNTLYFCKRMFELETVQACISLLDCTFTALNDSVHVPILIFWCAKRLVFTITCAVKCRMFTYTSAVWVQGPYNGIHLAKICFWHSPVCEASQSSQTKHSVELSTWEFGTFVGLYRVAQKSKTLSRIIIKSY